MTRLKMRVLNLAKFPLGESSDKALSAKHAYQAEQDRPRRSKAFSVDTMKPIRV